MRRTKARAPLPADAADTVRRLAAEGGTQQQIASALGMTKDRFVRYMKDPDFEYLRVAWEQGKSEDERRLMDLLLNISSGHQKGNVAGLMFLLKVKHGWREYMPIDDREPQGPQVVVMLPGSLPTDQYLQVVESKSLPVQRRELADGHPIVPISAERPQHPRGV